MFQAAQYVVLELAQIAQLIEQRIDNRDRGIELDYLSVEFHGLVAPLADGVPTRNASHRPSCDQAGEPGEPGAFPVTTVCSVAGFPAALRGEP